jgi:hypothetical protein
MPLKALLLTKRYGWRWQMYHIDYVKDAVQDFIREAGRGQAVMAQVKVQSKIKLSVGYLSC